MATSPGLRENVKLNNIYRTLTKDGATETGGERGAGVYGEYWGCAVVLWGCRDGTPAWNTYQQAVCAPTAGVG